MVVVDRGWTGAAVQGHTQGVMSPTVPGAGQTFTVASGEDAGWPAGVSTKIEVTINRDLSDQEHVLATRNGLTYTIINRGYDGSTAQDHSAGSTVDLYVAGRSVQLFGDHIDDVEADPHSTKLLNNARHDIEARHVFGGAYGTPATPAALTPDIAGAAGSGNNPAREDHVHNVPAAVATTITNANAEGAAATFARSDHNHAYGTGSIPAAAIVNDSIGLTQLASGFVTPASDLLAADLRIPYVKATAPGSPAANDLWFNTTTRTWLVRNAANTDWEMLASAGPGFLYTPTLYNISVGAGINRAYYRRIGRNIIVDGYLRFVNPGATTNANPIGVGLPPGVTAANSGAADQLYYHGAARAFDLPGGGAYAAVGLIRGATTAASSTDFDRISLFATAGSPAWNNLTPFTWDGSTDDGFSWFAQFDASSAIDANYD